MEWLAKLFFSIGLSTIGDKFLKPYLDHLSNSAKVEGQKYEVGTNAQRDVLIADGQNQLAAIRARNELLKGFAVTQWLIAAALVPPLMHQGSIYLDSTPFPIVVMCLVDFGPFSAWVPTVSTHEMGSWAVVKAPPPYDQREWDMIAGLLGIQGIVTGVTTGLKLLASKKG